MIRYSPLFDEYSIIATNRAKRPNKLVPVPLKVKRCPFCFENVKKEEEIFTYYKNAEAVCKVLTNIYGVIEDGGEKKSEGVFYSFPSEGRHEIIVDSPRHDANLWDFSEEEILNWLECILLRIEDAKKDKNITFLRVFKNSGVNAGATQPHPHTQLVGLNILSNKVLSLYKRSFDFYSKNGINLFESVFSAEKNIIDKNNSFFSFAPYASIHSYEIIISPEDFGSDMKNLEDLAEIIHISFRRLKAVLGEFDYNLYFEIKPLNVNFQTQEFFENTNKISTFFVRILPRLSRVGGFDISSGMLVNAYSPERVAKELKDVKIS